MDIYLRMRQWCTERKGKDQKPKLPEYEKGTTAYQIAESISPRLAAEVLVASVNENIYDLDRKSTV